MSVFERSNSGIGAPRRHDTQETIRRLAGLKLSLLDFIIALGRKVGGFCALLTLGWTYFRLLVLGESVQQLYPDAADADLRQTLWVGLLLIMAQGWDISTDRIAALWAAVRRRWPVDAVAPLPRPRPVTRVWTAIEPIFVRLGRLMDFCVAIANKIGAFAVLCVLIFIAWRFWITGASVTQMYPTASDPKVSLLADLCVYVVVLGWWATPFEQIRFFWERLRRPVEPSRA